MTKKVTFRSIQSTMMIKTIEIEDEHADDEDYIKKQIKLRVDLNGWDNIYHNDPNETLLVTDVDESHELLRNPNYA